MYPWHMTRHEDRNGHDSRPARGRVPTLGPPGLGLALCVAGFLILIIAAMFTSAHRDLYRLLQSETAGSVSTGSPAEPQP